MEVFFHNVDEGMGLWHWHLILLFSLIYACNSKLSFFWGLPCSLHVLLMYVVVFVSLFVFYIPCLFALYSLFYLKILIVYLHGTFYCKTFFWFLCFGSLLQFSNCICISAWVLFSISMCLLNLCLRLQLYPSFPSVVRMCFLRHHSVIYSTDVLSSSLNWADSLSPSETLWILWWSLWLFFQILHPQGF